MRAGMPERARHRHVERGVLVAVADPRAQHLERRGQAHRRLLLEERVHVAHQTLGARAAAPWRPPPPSSASATDLRGVALEEGLGAQVAAPLGVEGARRQRPGVADLDHVAGRRLWPAPWSVRAGQVDALEPDRAAARRAVGSSIRGRRLGDDGGRLEHVRLHLARHGQRAARARRVSFTTMRPIGLSSRTTSPVSVIQDVEVMPAKRRQRP